ncbi:MAG: glycosyltransferase family 4 protein [Betaproteobacteria bacterium]|nr:glycosyltransferase family 4 protein [Betaproteobacteria bacterium]
MRILEVCPYHLDRPGGVQRHILDLARALGRAGHDVTVLAPGAPGRERQEERDGYRILRLGRFRLWRLHGTAFEAARADAGELAWLADLHRQTPFAAVHFHTLWTPWLPWQVYRLLAGRGPRCVATFHDTPPPSWSGQLARQAFRLMSRLLSRRLDAAIAVSDAPASHLWLAPNCRLHTLPPCIDLRPLLEASPPQGDGRTILFLGRLEPRKGALLLIRAFALLRQTHPAARLCLAGDGAQAGAARALAAQLGVAQAVDFPGAPDEAAKRRLYRAADLFCAPSPYGESYGLVLAEAMAAGLPVVAAANAGYRTVLTGPGAAGLVAPGDAAALAARLAALLDAPEARRELAAWGRRQALNTDIHTRLEAFQAVLEGTA